ncbi:amidohydrolase [soil metagenome]
MIAALLALALASGPPLLITGGPIYTGEAASPRAQAVLVRDGRIAFVGAFKTAQAQAGPGVRRVDLKGAALFPGFTDSHAHLRAIGERELTLNLEGSKSAAEAISRLKAWIAAHPPAGGATLVGRGWIETSWPEKRFLTRDDIDAVAPSTPVLLVRSDGHALVANSAALKAAGISADTPDPFGGKVLKDAAGRPTGMLVDNAKGLVGKLMTAPTQVDRRAAFKEAFKVETRYGWTGVHSMSVSFADVPLLENMAARGEAPLRVYNAVDVGEAEPLFLSGPRASADGRITTRAIKMYADGALGSRGAALLEPYEDAPGSTGLLLLKPEQTAPILKRALNAGLQVCTHAIGDRANRVVLDLYEQAFADPPANVRRMAPRWRIEHAQNVTDADIPRFAALGVIPSMQPSHAIGDLHFAGARLGQARLSEGYAWKKLIDAGSIVPGGSDAQVERGDPLIEFYAAVARKDLKGYSGPGWHPEQAVDRATALKMFTAWPAYARFAEADLGTIAVGKRADLTAFSVDLMTAPETAIPKGHATLTVVDGAVVFTAP